MSVVRIKTERQLFPNIRFVGAFTSFCHIFSYRSFLTKPPLIFDEVKIMPHTVIYNSELHIVESKLHGDMTLGEVEVIITKIAKTAKENDCR